MRVKKNATSPIIPFHVPPLFWPYFLSGLSWMLKVKPSIVESSFSMSTRKPSNLRKVVNNCCCCKKDSLVPAAEVVGHDEGPVGDGGDLHLAPLEAGLHQGQHGQHQEEQHRSRHDSEKKSDQKSDMRV